MTWATLWRPSPWWRPGCPCNSGAGGRSRCAVSSSATRYEGHPRRSRSSGTMRIVILTQYYPPETGAPQARLHSLARSLVDGGHDVVVVTGMPNYPIGRIQEAWRRKVFSAENLDGVRVLRCWLFARPGSSLAVRMLGYLSFGVMSLFAVHRIRRGGARTADVVLWESPPIFLSPVAALLARALRARLVMNVSDLWPRTLVELGAARAPLVISLLNALERWSYGIADLVTCQTNGILDGVRGVAPSTPARLLPNGVECARFDVPSQPGVRHVFEMPEDGLVVGYAGNFGRAQAVEQVVRAAEIVTRREGTAFFWLMGAGPCRAEIAQEQARLGVAALRLDPPLPAGRMPLAYSAWDIGVVPLADRPLFAGARPSKMFELMAAGVPFVYCGTGEGADLAEQCGAGTVVPAEAPDQLAEAILALMRAGPAHRRMLGERARRFVQERFDRREIGSRFESELTALVFESAFAATQPEDAPPLA